MSERLHLETLFPFSHLPLPPGHLSPQNVWFSVCPEVPAFRCLPADPRCLQDVWFPAIWPYPLSLLTSSCLPAGAARGATLGSR